MAGRFVPIVDLAQEDENRNSHMSDIPLQLPASAHVASHNSALITFSQAENDLMQNVQSPSDTVTDGQILGNRVFQYIP